MRAAVLAPLIAACGLALAGCATTEPLAELPMKSWEHPQSVLRATAPRAADGETAFAMADIDTSRNRALTTYQTPREDYPSVGGNILRGQVSTSTAADRR